MTPRVPPSYTVAELEEETGFDRRTIAYYVQEELLPRVGRRGPRTRYPKLVRDRLLFIRRVREAEVAGGVPAVSLSEFRRIFERVSPALVAGVADGRLAVTEDLVLPAPTAFRLPEMRRAALRERVKRPRSGSGSAQWYPGEVAEGRPGLPSPAAPASEDRDGLAELLSRLQEAAGLRSRDAPRSMNTWTRIDISPEIVLSVRNIAEEDQELVEQVLRAMREAVSDGTPDGASASGQHGARGSDQARRER